MTLARQTWTFGDLILGVAGSKGGPFEGVALLGWRCVPPRPPQLTWKTLLEQLGDEEARVRIVIDARIELVNEHLSQCSPLENTPFHVPVILTPGHIVTAETPEGWQITFQKRLATAAELPKGWQ